MGVRLSWLLAGNLRLGGRQTHANEAETFYLYRLKGKKITTLKISVLTFVIGRDNKLLFYYKEQESSGWLCKSLGELYSLRALSQLVK